MRAVLAFAGRTAAWIIIAGAAAAILAAVIVPRLAGATPYTILTGSMSPSYPPGTLVVVKPVDAAELAVGDVVTAQLRSGRPEVVTHRISAVMYELDGGVVLETKGDANPSPDRDLRREEQLRGRVWYAVPYLGFVSTAFSGGERQWMVIAVAGGLGVYAVWMFASSWRDRRRGRLASSPEPDGHGERSRAGQGQPRTRSEERVGREEGGMRFRPVAVIAVLIGVLGAALVPATGASADSVAAGSGGVAFSTDGRTWGRTMPDALFDSRLRWVPGDSRTATLFVRNDSGLSARMQVEEVASPVDGLRDRGALTVEFRVGGESWRPSAGPGDRGVSSTPIAPNEVRSVEVRVSIPWESTNDAQTTAVNLDLRIVLTSPDAASPTPPDPVPSGAPPAAVALPQTGAAVPWSLIVVALALLAAGGMMLASRDRHREPRTERRS